MRVFAFFVSCCELLCVLWLALSITEHLGWAPHPVDYSWDFWLDGIYGAKTPNSPKWPNWIRKGKQTRKSFSYQTLKKWMIVKKTVFCFDSQTLLRPILNRRNGLFTAEGQTSFRIRPIKKKKTGFLKECGHTNVAIGNGNTYLQVSEKERYAGYEGRSTLSTSK
jgi:hypothetical protein